MDKELIAQLKSALRYIRYLHHEKPELGPGSTFFTLHGEEHFFSYQDACKALALAQYSQRRKKAILNEAGKHK